MFAEDATTASPVLTLVVELGTVTAAASRRILPKVTLPKYPIDPPNIMDARTSRGLYWPRPLVLNRPAQPSVLSVSKAEKYAAVRTPEGPAAAAPCPPPPPPGGTPN